MPICSPSGVAKAIPPSIMVSTDSVRTVTPLTSPQSKPKPLLFQKRLPLRTKAA
ncbi:hypothetical protein D3C84_1237970 [compost metagenome]